MTDQVVYRRIRGRIVPIRIKGKNQDVLLTKKTALGVVQAGTGAATAGYAGLHAHKFLWKGAQAENISKNFLGRALTATTKKRSLKATAKAVKFSNMSKALLQNRNLALFGGAAIGGTLIAKGFRNIFRDNKHLKKKDALGGSLAKTGGAFIAAGTIAALAYRRKVHPLESIHKAVQYAATRAKGHFDYLSKFR